MPDDVSAESERAVSAGGRKPGVSWYDRRQAVGAVQCQHWRRIECYLGCDDPLCPAGAERYRQSILESFLSDQPGCTCQLPVAQRFPHGTAGIVGCPVDRRISVDADGTLGEKEKKTWSGTPLSAACAGGDYYFYGRLCGMRTDRSSLPRDSTRRGAADYDYQRAPGGECCG